MKKLLTIASLALFLASCGGGSSNGNGNGDGSASNQQAQLDNALAQLNESSDTTVALSEEQKYALAFMWHEEKLAYDIYHVLNNLYPTNQLNNIQNSETTHIQAVEDLVATYDINVTNLQDYTIRYSESELRAMPIGEYAVPEVQALYDTLYAKGKNSQRDALEVGCMVEVTDINDLTKYIAIAQGKADLVQTFEFLRNGSYNHYWGFDKGLKNMGVSEGCCALGEEWCHPEYPQNSH
ncbi:MAG: DUF2202 domain-containing protein [Campylobacterales bacterium]|nr:DUF2202 domain-containing protein [Campylobacterales bacterium]